MVVLSLESLTLLTLDINDILIISFNVLCFKYLVSSIKT